MARGGFVPVIWLMAGRRFSAERSALATPFGHYLLIARLSHATTYLYNIVKYRLVKNSLTRQLPERRSISSDQ